MTVQIREEATIAEAANNIGNENGYPFLCKTDEGIKFFGLIDTLDLPANRLKLDTVLIGQSIGAHKLSTFRTHSGVEGYVAHN